METYGSGTFGEGTWGGRNVIQFVLTGGGQNLGISATHHGNLPAAVVTGGGTPAIVGRKNAHHDDGAISGGGNPTGFTPLYNQIPGGGFLNETATKHGIATVGLVELAGVPGSFYGEGVFGEAVYGAGATDLRIRTGGALAATGGAKTNYPPPPTINPSIDPPLSGGGDLSVTTRKTGADSSWVLSGGGYLHMPEVSFTLSGGGDGQIVARKRIRVARPLLRTGGATHQVGVKRRFTILDPLSGGGDLTFAGEDLGPGWRISTGGQGDAAGLKAGHGTFLSSDGGDLSQLDYHDFVASDGGALDAIGIKQALALLTSSDGGDLASAGIKQGLVALAASDGGDLAAASIKQGLAASDLTGGGDGAGTATKYTVTDALLSGGDVLEILASKHSSGEFTLNGGGRTANPILVASVLITGGGDILVAGVHGGVGVGVNISGGGGCWGPWPEVLYPKVALIDHESKVATLSSGVFTRTMPLALV
jgi:hypothetical protein